ncbi:hypothetical protein [Hyalangium rubrum]|uniref:Outer membrane protein beta-barrel domain-containing protein n=1 Tax=Hyalangium rubrum TaxID=3103134 RepID=A0ABU5H563_9BACT|nr:hypothetical protein [Hyalangium sp. s54d21]MDY7227907.1 hypothetical protein [Hyalangium sp. s54d21]
MPRGSFLSLLFTLAASTALAQDEDGSALKGGSRISVQVGGRFAFNNTFYDSYYARPENAGVARAAPSRFGPLVVGTFAYSITDSLELGIDLFGTLQQFDLTNQPRLTTTSYGALLGMRYQAWWDLGPHGTVPFLGVLTGPMLASTKFDGGKVRETLSQTWAVATGATLRLSPTWGLCVEYRHVFARAAVGQPDQRFSSLNAGGSWVSLGVTYNFPHQPSNPLERPF